MLGSTPGARVNHSFFSLWKRQSRLYLWRCRVCVDEELLIGGCTVTGTTIQNLPNFHSAIEWLSKPFLPLRSKADIVFIKIPQNHG